MKEKTARTWTPRLGLELPDVLLADIRDLPTSWSQYGQAGPTWPSWSSFWLYFAFLEKHIWPTWTKLVQHSFPQYSAHSQRYPPIARYGAFLVSQHGQVAAISQRYWRGTLWKQGKRVLYPPLRYYLTFSKGSPGPKRGCLNVGAWKPQESGRKAPLSCNAAFSMLQCSFSLAAAQLLVKITSALQKSQCWSATSAAQHSENCSVTSVFACGMLQGWGLEGWGLGLAERYCAIWGGISHWAA